MMPKGATETMVEGMGPVPEKLGVSPLQLNKIRHGEREAVTVMPSVLTRSTCMRLWSLSSQLPDLARPESSGPQREGLCVVR